LGVGSAAALGIGIWSNNYNRDRILDGAEAAYLATISRTVADEELDLEPFIPTLGNAYETYQNLRSPNGKNVSASGGKRYGGASVLFVRDVCVQVDGAQRPRQTYDKWESQFTHADTPSWDPNEAQNLYESDTEELIITVASFIAPEDDLKAERRKGFPPHEIRLLEFDGVKANRSQRKLLQQLGPLRGGTKEEMVYGGSAEGGYRWVVATTEQVRRNKQFLRKEVSNYFTHRVSTVSDCLDTVGDAMIEEHVTAMTDETNGKGLLKIYRTNPNGLRIKTTRDSESGALHKDGRLLDPDRPAISLEACALKYQAHLEIAELYTQLGDFERAEVHAAVAAEQKEYIIDAFWMEDVGYFASYLNANENGYFEQLQTCDSTPGEILTTGLLNLFDVDDRDKIEAIVKTQYSDEFLCDVGFRMAALSDTDLTPYWGYHRGMCCWRHVTTKEAEGVADNLLFDIAAEPFARVMAVGAVTRRHLELDYCDEKGRLMLPRQFRKPGMKRQKSILPLRSFYMPGVQRPLIEKNADDNQNWARGAYERAFDGYIHAQRMRRIYEARENTRSTIAKWRRHVQDPIIRDLERRRARFADNPRGLKEKIGREVQPYRPHIMPKNDRFEVA